MSAITTAELLADRAEHEATLAARFGDNVGERIKAMNAIRSINSELERREKRVAFTTAAQHARFMRAVLMDAGYTDLIPYQQ